MTYRILRIRGKSESARQARLQAAQAWMGRQGWQLVEYAEGSRLAMFEPAEEREEPSFLSAPPWRFPPGYWSGLAEEWLIPRNLLFGGVVAAVLVTLIVINALQHRFDPGEAARSARERWWTVAADGLNVREQPSNEAPVVGMFQRGQRVLVGEPKDGWIEIIQPQRGWAATQFLQKPEPEPGR